MLEINHLGVTFTGSVLDLKVELEGKEIGLHFDGVSEWTRTLEKFEIEDKLDVVMLCKGINGTDWKLEIEIDGVDARIYTGEIKKGYSLISDKIEIPQES